MSRAGCTVYLIAAIMFFTSAFLAGVWLTIVMAVAGIKP